MLEMYKGVVNSPETTITNDIDNQDTLIYILDDTVIPDTPNLMTLGTGRSAETVRVIEISGNMLTVERGFQGVPRSWNAGTIIARNFTEYDYNALKENIEGLDENIGDLDELDTTEKDNIVGAINEVKDDLDSHLAEHAYLQEDEPVDVNPTTLWFAIGSEVNFSEGGVVVENAEVSPTPPSEENLWFSIIE